jgi:hypothetical protein
LVELAPYGDVFYVANSNDQFAAYLMEPDGGLLTTFMRPPPLEGVHVVRCTTIAVHAPSSSLYCGHDEATQILAYDISDPERPVLRDPVALTGELWVRDLAVIGDTLYLSRFDRGLSASFIGVDGALGEPVQLVSTGNIRFVDGGEPLVAVSSDRGLIVFDGLGADATVRAELALDGPPQDLRVVEGRALVALGSFGVAVVDISSNPPRIEHTIRPPAVATSVDLEGAALAVTTLTGAYLYDLRDSPPRLAGFAPAGGADNRDSGVMLHGRFIGGDLVVSDWTYVERYAVDIDGEVLDVDHPRGLYLAPGMDAVIPFRNDGPHPIIVSLRVGADTVEATVPPTETVRVTVEAARVATLPLLHSDEPTRALWLTTRSAANPSDVRRSQVALLLRLDDADPPTHHPAPGDSLPSIALADPTSEIIRLPMTAERQRLMFFTTDCAAMWPVLEDAAYLSSRGALDEGAVLHLISQADIGAWGWNLRWGVEGIRYGHYDVYAPPAVVAENGTGLVYEVFFQIRELPGAAAFPTDYVVSTDGHVERVETYYRGAHPL